VVPASTIETAPAPTVVTPTTVEPEEPSPPADPEESTCSSDAAGDIGLFCWIQLDGETDWERGALLFAMGFFGALAAVYFTLGTELPGFGQDAEVRVLKGEVDGYKRLVDESFEKEDTADRRQALAAELRAREANYHRLRRQAFALGGILYPLLGGFFAAAAAFTLLQAVLIGFGWTSFASAIGLKRSDAASSAIKQEEVERSEREDKATIAALEHALEENRRRADELANAFKEAVKMVRPTEGDRGTPPPPPT
jgi:hypothetical protein